MRRTLTLIALAALAGCSKSQPQQQAQQPVIKVQSEEQKLLKQLDAFNLAIGLKRAIYDAGYTCKQVADAGFVGTYKNLDMQWFDGHAYSVRGLTGLYLTDGGLDLVACSLMIALFLHWWRRSKVAPAFA